MGSPYRRRPAATPVRVRSRQEHGSVSTTAEQRVTIARLRAGSPIEGVFACTRKDRLTARTGSAYLALELRDRTGTMPARAFRDADFLAGQFERGGLVGGSGRIEPFPDEPPAQLRGIPPAGPAAGRPA